MITKDYLRDLFHLTGAAGMTVNIRVDEVPYEVAAKLWIGQTDKSEFRQIILELIQESYEKPWGADPFYELILFAVECEIFSAIPEYKKALNYCSKNGNKQLQALSLKALISFPWSEPLSFWKIQDEQIGSQYPEVVICGLLGVDLVEAFNLILKRVNTKNLARSVIRLFPGAFSVYGYYMTDFKYQYERIKGGLKAEVSYIFDCYFDLHLLEPKEQFTVEYPCKFV